jgi:hypothetical protein
MRHVYTYILLFTLTTSFAFADKGGADITSTIKRREIIHEGYELEKVQPLIPMPANPINPFDNRIVPEETVSTTAAPHKPTIIELIRAGIKPEGFLRIGKRAVVIVNRKELKIGDDFVVTIKDPDNKDEPKECLITVVDIKPPYLSIKYQDKSLVIELGTSLQ